MPPVLPLRRRNRKKEMIRIMTKMLVLVVAVVAMVGFCAVADDSGNSVGRDSAWREGPTKEWFVNWDKALASAKSTGKPLFILHTGSDWCGTCKSFKTNILDSTEFIEFARTNLTLLYLDIPIRNPLCEEQKFHNWLIEKRIPFGKGVPDVLLMNAKGDLLGKAWCGRKSVVEYIDLLRKVMAEKGSPVKTAERLFNEGYACLAAEVKAERSRLPPVSLSDFKVAITGIAVVKSGYGTRLIKDAVFHHLDDPLVVPFGSEAVFRLEYQYPKGYEGITWVDPHRMTHWAFHTEYFKSSSHATKWTSGAGTNYATIALAEKGKTSTLCEVSVRINSDPRQGDLQFGWVSTNVSVNVTFKEKSDANASTTSGGKNKGLEALRARRRKLQEADKERCLEPVLPFDQAVRKAKDGDGNGLFSVAIHYAKGDEIALDRTLAMKYLQKAVDAGHANAALVKALLMEYQFKDCPDATPDNKKIFDADDLSVKDHVSRRMLYERMGSRFASFRLPHDADWYCATNESAVAEIRREYIKAKELGSPYAAEELNRFKRRIARIRKEEEERLAEEKAWRAKVNANARLAQELLGEPPETNPVYDRLRHTDWRDRDSLGDDAESERRNQHEALRQIQETLRKNRLEREKLQESREAK